MLHNLPKQAKSKAQNRSEQSVGKNANEIQIGRDTSMGESLYATTPGNPVEDSAEPRLFPVGYHPLDQADQFGKYRIEGKLGEGGMGVVYLATDTQLDRQVALKIPKGVWDQEANGRFLKEAKSNAAIDHPNICTLYEIGEVDDQPYLATAFIDGKTLANRNSENGCSSFLESAKLIHLLARTMSETHARGWIHRDLKPSNIMFDSRDQPMILDFGLAQPSDDLSSSAASMNGFAGTPTYASPEQIRGEKLNAQSDIYSLGVMMYELLTGELPHFSPDVMSLADKVLNDTPRNAVEVNHDVPSELSDLCNKAMSKDPGARFSSMSEFAEQLGKYIARQEKRNAASETGASNQSIPRKKQFALMAICAAVLIVGLVKLYAAKFDASTRLETVSVAQRVNPNHHRVDSETGAVSFLQVNPKEPGLKRESDQCLEFAKTVSQQILHAVDQDELSNEAVKSKALQQLRDVLVCGNELDTVR